MIPDALFRALSASTSSPGGGSAAAAAGALSAALVAMVAGIAARKEKDVDVRVLLERVVGEAKRLMEAQSARIEEDDRAYQAVVQAYRLPKGGGEEEVARQDAIREAIIAAGEVPLATARDAVAATELLVSVIDRTSENCKSDVSASVAMARASLESAESALQANAITLEPGDTPRAWTEEISTLKCKLETNYQRIRAGVGVEGGSRSA